MLRFTLFKFSPFKFEPINEKDYAELVLKQAAHLLTFPRAKKFIPLYCIAFRKFCFQIIFSIDSHRLCQIWVSKESELLKIKIIMLFYRTPRQSWENLTSKSTSKSILTSKSTSSLTSKKKVTSTSIPTSGSHFDSDSDTGFLTNPIPTSIPLFNFNSSFDFYFDLSLTSIPISIPFLNLDTDLDTGFAVQYRFWLPLYFSRDIDTGSDTGFKLAKKTIRPQPSLSKILLKMENNDFGHDFATPVFERNFFFGKS